MKRNKTKGFGDGQFIPMKNKKKTYTTDQTHKKYFKFTVTECTLFSNTLKSL